jgi:hypothetical protein
MKADPQARSPTRASGRDRARATRGESAVNRRRDKDMHTPLEVADCMRATMASRDVGPARISEVMTTIAAGGLWHPKDNRELQAAIEILVETAEGRPGATAAIQFVGPALEAGTP